MNSNSNQSLGQCQNETENDLEEEELNDIEIENQNESNNNNGEDDKITSSGNNIKNTESNEEPIYVMTLALEQGKSEKIEIFSNSDPSELAYNFCKKNNLDFNALDYLREQITNLLETYAKNENDEEEEDDNNLNEQENKEGDINIPEIQEVQEDQEINSTDNLKESNFDIKSNDNNNDEFKINSLEKGDIQINEISPEEMINDNISADNNEDNNREINDSQNDNEKKEFNNSKIIDNDEENDNDNHDDDEIVEEIDFQNIKHEEKEKDNELKTDKDNNININGNIESQKQDKNDQDNNCINNEIKSIYKNKNNFLENELFLVENNDDKEADNNDNIIESERGNNNNSKETEKDNSYDKNISKKKYKINEDIIIGVGDFNNNMYQSNEELEINEIEINDIERMKREILENEKILNDNLNIDNDMNKISNIEEDNNIIYNNVEKNNEKNDFYKIENNQSNHEENHQKCDDNTNNLKEKSETYNFEKDEKDNYSEQFHTNNYAQETKTNTNNNILLSEDEDNNQNKEQYIIKDKDLNKESLLNKTNKILNESIKKNSNDYINNINQINNNIIIPKYEDLTFKKNSNKKSSSNKNVINCDIANDLKDNNNDLIINKNDNYTYNNNKKNNIIIPEFPDHISHYNYAKDKYLDEKKNTYTYNNSINNNNKNLKRIKQNDNLRNSDVIGKNAKNYIKYLSERNKLLKEEKDKEILSLEKEINKCDLKMNIKNNNIKNIYEIQSNNNNDIKNNFLKNNNQIYSTNYYNKNINYRKLNKLKEEYDKKYSFQPIINDNYKTDLTFDERLNIFNNISKQKKEELKNNLSNLKSDENGQEFFKPKLISRQTFLYNKKNNGNINEIEGDDKIDVFNKNYLYYKKYNSNKEKLYQYYYNNTNEPHIFSKVESEKLLNEANNKAFSNLFNELDSDQDNLITSFHINLNNIPNNILKIIEPLLIELKEDNQTLNQDEFIKAMTKLFENISSTERRQIINEYNNRRQRNISDKNDNIPINYNKNKKNNSLSKNKNNNLNNINYKNYNSQSRMLTRNYVSTENNNFDSHYLSCRPRTPVYKMVHKNSSYDYFNNLNKKKSQKTIVNNNTNKLAHKHFMRIQKMMSDYNNKYKTSMNQNNMETENDCFDRYNVVQRNNNGILNAKTPKFSYRSIFLNENKKFNSINDCTFNNYLKNLN